MTSSDSKTMTHGSAGGDRPGGEAMAVIARGLGFTYEKSDVPALSGLDLSLPHGSTTAVVGASGAGKSTLCLTMNGLAPRFARGLLVGDLHVLGRRMGDVPVHEMASSVGMVLQDFEVQLFSTSAELEVAFGLENLGIEPERMRDIVAMSLMGVGLSGFEKRDPSTLSGGEKQRLAIAAVLAMNPRLLVLDEPTSDLDPHGRRDVMSIVSSLKREGRSTLIVEHETDELLAADTVIVLEGGCLVMSGPPQEIFRRCERLRAAGVRPPQLPELCELLGLNFVPRDLDEAESLIRDKGIRVDQSRCRELWGRGENGEPRVLRAREAKEPIVRMEGVAHSYEGGADAIRDVTLEIKRGEFVAVVGVNGSGKTTLVKQFNGLLLPRRGTVLIDGLDTGATPLSAVSQRVGFVFQNPDHQIFSETVADELAFGPRNAGMDEGEIARRCERALAAVRMEGSEEADPFALTKGERQRVALASVLVMEPSVIVMDEPTTGLDFTQQKQVMRLLLELNRNGHTIVIVTHSLWLAAMYARRTIVMSEGRVVADGPTRQVMAGGGGLDAWSLVSPPVVSLGRRLGVPALTVSEFAFCLGAEMRHQDDWGGDPRNG